jgi:predicted O-methyltransferase YrrM
LGTCVGISAAYIGAALEMNGAGRLVTMEGGSQLVDRSRRTLEDLGLGHRVTVIHGPFERTLGEALKNLDRLDLAFIDGHHQEEPTLRYTERVFPHLSAGAVLAYDDIHWSRGMDRAWSRLEQDPRFTMTLDLGGMGLAVVGQTADRTNERISFA